MTYTQKMLDTQKVKGHIEGCWTHTKGCRTPMGLLYTRIVQDTLTAARYTGTGQKEGWRAYNRTAETRRLQDTHVAA